MVKEQRVKTKKELDKNLIKKGAWLGLIAYIMLGLIVAMVFFYK